MFPVVSGGQDDTSPRRASGSIFGLAYGDALGKPTEFLTVAEITRRYGPAGPQELSGSPALATALLCAVRHADDPVAALARGAATAGDSDSIAALAGAFVGAAEGIAAWPGEWAGRIEYADQLAALGAAWD